MNATLGFQQRVLAVGLAGFLVAPMYAADPPANAATTGQKETNGTSKAAEPAPPALEDVRARRIAPYDILSIHVVGEPDLTLDKRVEADGTISFPFLGLIKVLGKPTLEVERFIHDELDKDWIINPQVSVDFKTYDVQYVTVVGAVGRPGPVQIPPDHRMDILEAIGGAGDFTREANRNLVYVRRAKTLKTTAYRYDDLFKTPLFTESGDLITIGKTIF